MKVILVEPYAHRIGHYGVEAWHLAQSLSSKGVNIILVSFDGFINKGNPEIVQNKIKHISFSSDAGVITKLLVLFLHKFLSLINYSRLINRMITILETFSTLQIADKISRNERDDIIYCNDGELIGFFLYASSVSQKKFLFKRVDYAGTFSSTGFGRKSKRYIEDWLCRKTIRNNKVIFTCSVEGLTNLYQEMGFPGDCVYAPPQGVLKPEKKIDKSEARSYLNIPMNETVLLVFGTGHGGKDFDTILSANLNADRRYLILFAGKVSLSNGNGPEKLARKYNSENISVVDKFIPEHEVPYYFNAADGLLLSYKRDFTEDSAVLLQGVSYGLPIIASNTGWIGETITNKGLGMTFDSENPSSLKEAIEKFLQLNEDSETRIRENMQRFAESFSWDRVVDEDIKLMTELQQ